MNLSYLDQPGDIAGTHKPLRFGEPGNPGTFPKPLLNGLRNPTPGDQRNHLLLVSGDSLKPLASEPRCSVIILPEELTTLLTLLLLRTCSCEILTFVWCISQSIGLFFCSVDFGCFVDF